MEFQVKFCHSSEPRLWRTGMLLFTKFKGHKSNVHCQWRYIIAWCSILNGLLRLLFRAFQYERPCKWKINKILTFWIGYKTTSATLSFEIFPHICKCNFHNETNPIVWRREAKRVQLSWVSWARCQEPPQFHFKELQSKNPWPTLLGNDFAWFCNYGQAKPTLWCSRKSELVDGGWIAHWKRKSEILFKKLTPSL